MYKSFEVHNFRGLSSLRLDDLARINLIAGQNNVGKTSVLEAIYLHCGSYGGDLLSRFDAHRGFPEKQLAMGGADDPPWISLFPQFDLTQVITLYGEFTTGKKLRMELRMPNPDDLGLFARSMQASATPQLLRVGYGVTNQNGPDSGETFLTWTRNGVQYSSNNAPSPSFRVFFQPALDRPDFSQSAEWYSNLEVHGQQEIIATALRVVEPRLRRLLVLVTGGVAMLHADVGTGRPLPLALLGEGMNRLASLVLALGNAPGGVVLIDEIENGLHYSALPNVWRAVGAAARLFDTQVFATTHSYECIAAAQAAFDNTERDLQLYRLERQGDELRTIGINEEALTTLLEMGMEVR